MRQRYASTAMLDRERLRDPRERNEFFHRCGEGRPLDQAYDLPRRRQGSGGPDLAARDHPSAGTGLLRGSGPLGPVGQPVRVPRGLVCGSRVARDRRGRRLHGRHPGLGPRFPHAAPHRDEQRGFPRVRARRRRGHPGLRVGQVRPRRGGPVPTGRRATAVGAAAGGVREEARGHAENRPRPASARRRRARDGPRPQQADTHLGVFRGLPKCTQGQRTG